MQIEHRIPDRSCDLSLAPIDVGLDLRVGNFVCALPATARRVGYERDGEARIVTGTTVEIIDELTAAGYRVEIVSDAITKTATEEI